MMRSVKRACGAAGVLGIAVLAGCGGSSGPGASSPVFPPPSASLSLASQATPFTADCNGAPQSGKLYLQAEVEPYVALNPTNTLNVLGVWQQDRWSNGGAQGLMAAASYDGGLSWNLRPLPTSACAGGTAANGGDYERASDPWVSFSPTGIAYAISLSFNDSDSTSAILVTRSSDGGSTWGNPATLIRDTSQVLNDKESITADPTDANYVYAVWDRINGQGYGPTWFSRTSDGGQSWDAASLIYDPGQNAGGGNQTLGNQIVVLPNDTLVNLFTEIDDVSGNYQAALKIIRSTDHGSTWSTPVTIASVLSVGTTAPQTGTTVRTGAGIGDIAVGPSGNLYAVWQDSRFSGGKRDGIALSESTDGGLSWSAPVEVNAVPSTQAFTPSITVLSNGTLAVTYYDFRNDTPDPSTLPTDLWETLSTDGGTTWRERHVSGPFNLDIAPNAEGLFLGDYQGLSTDGTDPLPFFVRTVVGPTGPTDVFAFPPALSTRVMMAISAGYKARAAGASPLSEAVRQRIGKNLQRLIRHERPRTPLRSATPD